MAATKETWVGVIDCLGYLVCKACNEVGRGHRLESYVFDPPHSEEPCDFCGNRLGLSFETIDWGDPERNMYGCTPCPRCGSKFRYGRKLGDDYTVECDECRRIWAAKVVEG